MTTGNTIIKYIITLLSFIIVLPAMAKTNPFDQPKLPFEKATIHYQVSGNSTGSETLYIQNHGQETARRSITTQKIMFMTQQVDTLEITSPDWLYHIDFATKQGNKSTNPQKFMLEEYDKLPAKDKKTVEKNIKEMGYAGMSMLQGKLQPKADTILGYECDKIELMGSTIYSIHNTSIALKTITKLMGMDFSSVAVKIDKDKVSSDAFIPPSDITIMYDENADQMARNQAQHMLSILKDPNAAEKMKQTTEELMIEQQKKQDENTNEGQNEPSDVEMGETLNKAMDALKQMMGQ